MDYSPRAPTLLGLDRNNKEAEKKLCELPFVERSDQFNPPVIGKSDLDFFRWKKFIHLLAFAAVIGSATPILRRDG